MAVVVRYINNRNHGTASRYEYTKSDFRKIKT